MLSLGHEDVSTAKKQESGPVVLPLKLTPISGRVSRTKKGMKVFTCDMCNPPKVWHPHPQARMHTCQQTLSGSCRPSPGRNTYGILTAMACCYATGLFCDSIHANLGQPASIVA